MSPMVDLFISCRGIGRLIEEDLPPESKFLHDEIIHLRDKLYAHKDLNLKFLIQSRQLLLAAA
jgi:hypothetical protein